MVKLFPNLAVVICMYLFVYSNGLNDQQHDRLNPEKRLAMPSNSRNIILVACGKKVLPLALLGSACITRREGA